MVHKAAALLLMLFRCRNRVTASSLNPQPALIHFDFQTVLSANLCVCCGKGKEIRVTRTGDECPEPSFEVVVIVIEAAPCSIRQLSHNVSISSH